MGEGRVLEARPVALYHGGRQDGDDVTRELAKRRVQSQEKNVENSILGLRSPTPQDNVEKYNLFLY